MNLLRRFGLTTVLSCFISITFPTLVFAQEETEDETEETIETLVVTGSQIRGADISGLLPVTVVGAEEIDSLGVESGDELFEALPEQGQNFFNEEENISGGVNSARGDMGAFNLRNLGTGNTLVLLNGRRMVNAASYQTEAIGGSFVPVNTVNSNTIPIFGVERIELLKDGASAIYGADAVAGVVNTVLRNDVEGFKARYRTGQYETNSRQIHELNLEWGTAINDGATNIAVLFDYYTRNNIHSSEDPRWANSDLRPLVPEDSLWAGELRFRNSSASSLHGQFDIVRSVRGLDIRNVLVDTAGEFEVYPVGEARCQWAINDQVCGGRDNQGTYRYNLNEFRDLSADLERNNVFVFVNHDLGNNVEAFSEALLYKSATVLSRHPSAPFSSVKLRVDAENYYNPFGPCGSQNRLPESLIGDVPCEGLDLEIDFYRFAEVPRIIHNDGKVFRLLQGFRGMKNDWDWEVAGLYSRATREDVTLNRVSNTLMKRALEDPTPAAYNPFSGGLNSNIERALVSVYRNHRTALTLLDFKLSNPTAFEILERPVAALAGVEYRKETFIDDRDPRLDGTVVFTDYQGDTYPFVSDVVNSSPTPDNEGTRKVVSLFTEFQSSITNNLDMQAAIRWEDFSDIGSKAVGKLAGGYRITDTIHARASWSQSFRVPNLVTVNEDIVARQNTRNDYTCFYAAEFGGDPGEDIVDCRYSMQRVAEGSDLLIPETSNNFSVGIVFDVIEGLTFTTDYWSIVKEDTIGLLGEENHTIYDLLLRLRHGPGSCDTLAGNPAVQRSSDIAGDVAGVYEAAGICPAGDIDRVEDIYANLDTRTLEGIDFGIYWDQPTDFGTIRAQFLHSQLITFEQEAGGPAAALVEAHLSGELPPSIPLIGFDNLVQKDGNQKWKNTALISWRKDQLYASLSSTGIGEIYQSSLTLSDGTLYWLPSMRTFNARFDYKFDFNTDWETRLRVGIRNLTNERAPLADRYFGFFADAHRDYGRYIYTDIQFRYR